MDQHRRPAAAADAWWRTLAARYWPQWVAAALMYAALKVVDPWEPRPTFIYHQSDAEYWQYSYPFMEDTVPLWAVPCLTLYLPLLVFVATCLVGWVSRLEAHHACLNLFACVATAGFLGNLLKSQVARPRPDFVARCWPSTLAPVWGEGGAPQCEEGVPHQTIKTGMRSFPSVHAAWSGAGLGFLCLWMAGRLRCFAAGGARPARLMLALAPLFAAGWIGVTRIQNNRHHVSDVLGAYALGFSLALAFYLQAFCNPLSARAGSLKADEPELQEGASRARGAGYLPADEPASEPLVY